MARDYAALLHSYLKEMDCLSDAEFGRLCRALLRYSAEGEPIALNGNERFFANRAMMQEDKFKASYEASIKQRSEAGKASARQRAMNADEREPTDANARLKQINTNQVNTSPSNEGEYKTREKRFTPPTVEEARAYFREKGYADEAEAFVDFYTAKGWKVGRNPMKDWKAAIRNWARNDYSRPKKKNIQPSMDYGDVSADIEAMRRMAEMRAGR